MTCKERIVINEEKQVFDKDEKVVQAHFPCCQLI